MGFIDIFNYTIDFMFAVDILVNFNTTYLDDTGEEIKNRKDIINNYLKGMFIIDLMATVPFYEMFCILLSGNISSFVKTLSILKLI